MEYRDGSMKISWKRIALETAILASALLFQQTLIRWISLGSIRPDLTLIALMSLALRRGSIAGLYAGLALGLVQDVYAFDTLGASALSNCLVGYALGFFEDKVIKSLPATRILLLGAALILHDVVFYLASGFRGGIFWSALFRLSLPSGVYTLLLGGLIFYLSLRFKPREA